MKLMPTARPLVTGQCAEVLALIRQHGPILSLELTANHAIPEAAARVHDLRNMGFNIRTIINKQVFFRGRPRRNVATYALGSPDWPSPEFSAQVLGLGDEMSSDLAELGVTI